MALFQRKATVFQKKDRAGWLAAREALKAAGIPGVRASECEVEPPVCGCGSKLDPRDFGAKGKVDRNLYVIRVPEDQVQRAREVLGDLAVVEEPQRKGTIYG